MTLTQNSSVVHASQKPKILELICSLRRKDSKVISSLFGARGISAKAARTENTYHNSYALK